MSLDGDCWTDETIVVPDGFTLNLNRNELVAVNPPSDIFRGGVVANGGNSMHVENGTVRADSLTGCAGGADRLSGIRFAGASGSVSHVTVSDINRGPSGCQEGVAIWADNFTGGDGTWLELSHNNVARYQKGGIVVNGDVAASIHHNRVGASATQANLAANSVQVGFGAVASVVQNRVEGNQWLGTSFFAATAVLVFDAAADVNRNIISGNSDVGVILFGDGSVVENNKVFDQGADHPNSCCDVGIWNFGSNVVTNNKIRGFDTPLLGAPEGDNKFIPSPNN